MRDTIKYITTKYIKEDVRFSDVEYVPCTGCFALKGTAGNYYRWECLVTVLDSKYCSYAIYNAYTYKGDKATENPIEKGVLFIG